MVNLFVFCSCLVFGMVVTMTMIFEQTFDVAQASFRNEDSVIYRMTAAYFQFNIRHRNRAQRERRRERRYHREQNEIDQ